MTTKKVLLFICGLLCWIYSGAQATGRIKRVLFIGNSYTAVNNLPELVSRFAASAGDSVFTAMSTPGGFTFQAHSTYAPTLNLIQQSGWDFVVLQEQSQRPAFSNAQVQQEVFPYAKTLDSIIHHFNPCAKVVFYRTWGRQNGDQSNCAVWPPVCTYKGMDSLLALRYRQMADSNQAYLAPVGDVWQKVRNQFPQVTLYQSDGSHPEIAGSYLAAATFYTAFFRTNPEIATFRAGIDSLTALLLRKVVKQVVFDTLSNWNVGKWDPKASFSFNIQGLSVQFNNTSQNSSSSRWLFGDGQTDTVWSPVHNYLLPGSYSISLKTEKCDWQDSTSHSINLTTTLSEEPLVEEDRFLKENGSYKWIMPSAATSFAIVTITGQNVHQSVENVISAVPGTVLILRWERNGKYFTKKLVF